MLVHAQLLHMVRLQCSWWKIASATRQPAHRALLAEYTSSCVPDGAPLSTRAACAAIFFRVTDTRSRFLAAGAAARHCGGDGCRGDARQRAIPDAVVHLLVHERARLLRQRARRAERVQQAVLTARAVNAVALADGSAAAREEHGGVHKEREHEPREGNVRGRDAGNALLGNAVWAIGAILSPHVVMVVAVAVGGVVVVVVVHVQQLTHAGDVVTCEHKRGGGGGSVRRCGNRRTRDARAGGAGRAAACLLFGCLGAARACSSYRKQIGCRPQKP
eukprot:354629-Chlamydomonas_euryale.AAC.5